MDCADCAIAYSACAAFVLGRFVRLTVEHPHTLQTAVRRGNERRDVESSTARAPARRIDAPEVPATGTRHHGSGQAASGRPWSFNRQASCGSSWHKPHTPAASVDVVADVLDSREGVAVVGTEQDVPSRGPSRTRRSQQQPGLPAAECGIIDRL